MPSDILIIPNRNSTSTAPVIQFSGSAVSNIRLEVLSSGSIAFLGNSGSLFAITDILTGSLYAVSDISGLPILEVFSDDRVVMGRYNTNALVVTGSAVGIGTSSPIAKLHVYSTGQPDIVVEKNRRYGIFTNSGWLNDGFSIYDYTSDGSRLTISSAGDVGIGTNSPAAKLHVVGDIVATGNITSTYSDDRLKTRLGKIDNAVEKIKTLDGFYFAPNDTAMALGYPKKIDVGVSAQQIKEVLPEVVSPAPIDPQYMTVRYEKIIPLLIEAIKEQQNQIEDLKKQVETLSKK